MLVADFSVLRKSEQRTSSFRCLIYFLTNTLIGSGTVVERDVKWKDV